MRLATPMRVLAVVLLLAAPALAGCLDTPDEASTPAAAPTATLAAALANVTAPAVDGPRGREWFEAWVEAHPFRLPGSPTNVRASEAIRSGLEESGYEAEIFQYLPNGGASQAGVRVVIGVKEGASQPDHAILWLAHYDSVATSPYAAYDDGSGTAVAMEVARALAEYPNEKTLLVAFFDAEEEGALASSAVARDLADEENLVIDLVVGLDMTGINCPGHEWPLYHHPGEAYAPDILARAQELYTHLDLAYGLGEDSKECIVLLETHDRNSDENVFKALDFPVLRLSGGRNAADYPEYHKPGDTVDFVYSFMGGQENYEKGLAAVATATAWTIIAYDRLPSLVEEQ